MLLSAPLSPRSQTAVRDTWNVDSQGGRRWEGEAGGGAGPLGGEDPRRRRFEVGGNGRPRTSSLSVTNLGGGAQQHRGEEPCHRRRRFQVRAKRRYTWCGGEGSVCEGIDGGLVEKALQRWFFFSLCFFLPGRCLVGRSDG
jgi:hypothetical protein